MNHTLDLCCVIPGEYAMYLAGKLEAHPNLITIYIAHCPQTLSSNIYVLPQLKHTTAFSFGTIDFIYNQEFSAPGENIYYTVM